MAGVVDKKANEFTFDEIISKFSSIVVPPKAVALQKTLK